MRCFICRGHAVLVTVVFSCTLEFYCNLHNEFNAHFSFYNAVKRVISQQHDHSLTLLFSHLFPQIDG